MNYLEKRIFKKIKENAPDGTISYRSYYQIMGWFFHLKKHESKEMLLSWKGKGLVKLGNKGFLIL